MKKVITYGTYDMLHYGHVRLLERAKALGDYLIVGVTSDDFDRSRGKINVQQSLEERIASVRSTGLADQIIVEEYEGQKIEDIIKYNVDIFTVGSDWQGKFDYLKEYCDVVYLERTEGISSSSIRAEESAISLGIVGKYGYINKVIRECSFVNGIKIAGICSEEVNEISSEIKQEYPFYNEFNKMLPYVNAVYIHSYPQIHYEQIKKALLAGKHVMCESPLALTRAECKELHNIADDHHVILMESIRTAYSTAYSRMLLLIKSGKIGHVTSVDATCTSLKEYNQFTDYSKTWSSITDWGPNGMLPVFDVLGTEFKKSVVSHIIDTKTKFDDFSIISFVFPDAVASVKVGTGVKSEGELIISGTKGYVYVPAPWWKTDYFELRYENPANNKRYFYQLDGEGIRYEFVAFSRAIKRGKSAHIINSNISNAICGVLEDYYAGVDTTEIK